VTLDIEPVGKIRMFLNPDDKVITTMMLFWGHFEPKETDWFVRLVEPGDTIVDVGANVGYYTLIGAKLVGEKGRVFAFEPDPVSFALLERNVRLNGLTNVVLERKAVSSEAGSIRLYLAAGNKGDHRIYQPSQEERAYVEVEAVTFDGYFADDSRGIDFTKIDTQGAEVVILRGMENTLRENPELQMAVEYWPWGLSDFGFQDEQLLGLVNAAGFRIFDLAGKAGTALRETDLEDLRSRYTKKNKRHSNLLLFPGATSDDSLKAYGSVRLRSERASP
jgi:FkbM family methyltransferase